MQDGEGATYIPIPSATNQNFAGLFTVDLPLGVTHGEVFNIVVRRLTTKNVPSISTQEGRAESARLPIIRPVRTVTGAFQVTIPVTTETDLLAGDENTLAVLKWRLQEMSPLYRWRPVVKRHIEYLSSRVDASGGDASSIPPSLDGWPVGRRPHPVGEEHCVGKVVEVIFDCFGDFEGFVVESCGSSRHRFKSRERAVGELMLRACSLRWTMSVRFVQHGDKICGIRVLN